MTGWKWTIDVATRSQALTVVGVLGELLAPAPDAHTIFEQPPAWRVEAYFSSAIGADDIASRVADLTGLDLPDSQVSRVADLNWVEISQAALPPVQAGRFCIYGAHDRSRIARGPFAIEIDAGEAFGTAHHATTSGCLEAIDRLARFRRCDRVLDLGCGTGVLAIAALRVWPRARVRAADIDPVAVEVARANIKANGARRRIDVVHGNGLQRRPAALAYDLVVANILAAPLIDLAPRIARMVGQGGWVILSGVLIEQAGQVGSAYVCAGFALIDIRLDAGWAVLVLRRVGSRPAARMQRAHASHR